MSDPRQQLRSRLEALDAELARTDPADEDQREVLLGLRRDVQALLERSANPAPPDDDPFNLDNLRTGLQHFEVTHPVLSTAIEQVLTTLSNMGI
jgi:hypothetical protein